MNTDGAKKKKGKFLKKGSNLFDKIKIQEYNFAEINNSFAIDPDNGAQNIFYTRFHEKSDFREVVSNVTDILPDIEPIDEKTPVIFPRDFTNDWLEEKRKAKRRSANKKTGEDEDDDEFSFQEDEEEEDEREEREHFERERLAEKSASKKNHAKKDKIQSFAPQESDELISKKQEEFSKEIKSELTANDLNKFNETKDLESLQSAQKSGTATLEELGKAITSFTGSTLEESDLLAAPKEEKPEIVEDHSQSSVPAENSNDKEEIDLDKIKEEAYQEGLKEGKDKAYLETKNAANSILESLDKGLIELSKMNKEVMKKSQKNFYEIASAMSESILEKNFSINPNSFKKIIDKAINETIKDDPYTVKVNPVFLKALKELELPGLDKQWIEDETVKPGEFIIESSELTLQSDIKDIVKNMLKDVDLSLFEQNELNEHNEQENDEVKSDPKDETS